MFVLERPHIFKDEIQVIGENGEEESFNPGNPYHYGASEGVAKAKEDEEREEKDVEDPCTNTADDYLHRGSAVLPVMTGDTGAEGGSNLSTPRRHQSVLTQAKWYANNSSQHRVKSSGSRAGAASPTSPHVDYFLRFVSEPFLLVNIGSGVSILHVGPTGFSRVGGTGCGGGTFLGLTRLLCPEVGGDYEQALQLASEGDASSIDILVKDIYGEEGSKQLGLPGSLTASNFGKLGALPRGKELVPRGKDLARACLQLVSEQVAVLARAFSESLETQHIFFTGGFLERNRTAKRMVSNAMRSLGKQAFFPRHCDFLGAIGSLAHSLAQKDIEL